MNSGAHILQRLPAAPVAEVPEGITADGAARTVWRPNVLLWVTVWRLVIAVQAVVTVAVTGAEPTAVLLATAMLAYGLLNGVLAAVRPDVSRSLVWRSVDLTAMVVLIVAAPDALTLQVAALYAASGVVTWAADHPAGAFLAGGVMAVAYALAGTLGAAAADRPDGFASTIALYFFFALAVSGFFTVARRISALEVATEMSNERGRYRRDLHDRLGQALCGLHFEVQALQATGPDEQAPERFGSLADGYASAREMLDDLFRDTDEPLMATDIGSLIRQQARRLADQSGVAITANIEGDASHIPPWMRPHVFSIAIESMTNALKNGEADSVDIDLLVDDGMLLLLIRDDGIGFEHEPGELPEKTGHYGLQEMAERARMCGGEVVVASEVGVGTNIRLTVPLEADQQSDAIIDRDASALRAQVWDLVMLLRLALGLVALVQAAVAAVTGSGPQAAVLFVAAVMTVDVAWPTIRLSGTSGMRHMSDRLLGTSIVLYGTLFGISITAGIPPWFLLYGPLVLLLAGVANGRRQAAWGTVALVGVMLAAIGLTTVAGVATSAISGSLLYVTNAFIIGLCASQGARLLDRLEALQIRVRFQALALIRQSLGSQTHNDLSRELDSLEDTTRDLATRQVDETEFAARTSQLADGSTALKERLREIVHQLAEPTPGRT